MDLYTNTTSHRKRLPAFIILISILFLVGASYAQPLPHGDELPSLSAAATAYTPESGPELYAQDFDPLQALPMPPAWRETEGFDDTADILSQRLATEEQVRVRVTLRLPAVESERLDEAQGLNWNWEQAAVAAELLASLPTGTYAILDDPKVASSLTLAVQDASLEELMASPLVANVSLASIPSGFTNTRIDPPVVEGWGYFGSKVQQSGNVALVHQNNTDSYDSNQRFYLFRRINNVWVEDKREQPNQVFSTAIEGDLVAVGKPTAEPMGLTDEGDITVYHWSGSYWNTDSISLPTEHRQAGANLGSSLAISGNTLAVGAPGWDLLNDGSGNRFDNVGRVYVWVRQADGQWQFQAAINNQRLPTNLRKNNDFGSRVRLAGDTLLVNLRHSSYEGSCQAPCDHVPSRSYPIFLAWDVLRTLREEVKRTRPATRKTRATTDRRPANHESEPA